MWTREAARAAAEATRAGPWGRLLVRAWLGHLAYDQEPAVPGALHGDDTTTESDGQADADAAKTELDLKERLADEFGHGLLPVDRRDLLN